MTDHDILITRTFDAPRERVFDAWTDPTQFAVWFGTESAAVDQVEMDLRPGGAWSARMTVPEHGVISWHGTFHEVERPQRLSLTLSDNDGDLYDLCTVVLVDVGGKTEMTFTQDGGHMDADAYAGAKAGWQQFFDTMEGVLAG